MNLKKTIVLQADKIVRVLRHQATQEQSYPDIPEEETGEE